MYKTVPTKFLPQQHHSTRTGLVPGHGTPTHRGTDHTPPTMDTDMAGISTSHNHTQIPTMTGVAAVTGGTHHTLHPATTAVHVAFCLMDAPIATHTITHHTYITTPHPRLTTFSTNITHASIPQTRAGVAPHCLGKAANEKSQTTPKTFNPPYIPPF